MSVEIPSVVGPPEGGGGGSAALIDNLKGATARGTPFTDSIFTVEVPILPGTNRAWLIFFGGQDATPVLPTTITVDGQSISTTAIASAVSGSFIIGAYFFEESDLTSSLNPIDLVPFVFTTAGTQNSVAGILGLSNAGSAVVTANATTAGILARPAACEDNGIVVAGCIQGNTNFSDTITTPASLNNPFMDSAASTAVSFGAFMQGGPLAIGDTDPNLSNFLINVIINPAAL